MAFAAWLPKVRYHSEHCNERTWICYHQAPPWVRVVAHVGDAGQAKPHLEHNPLSLLGTCHAMALRKLNDPGCVTVDSKRYPCLPAHWRAGQLQAPGQPDGSCMCRHSSTSCPPPDGEPWRSLSMFYAPLFDEQSRGCSHPPVPPQVCSLRTESHENLIQHQEHERGG